MGITKTLQARWPRGSAKEVNVGQTSEGGEAGAMGTSGGRGRSKCKGPEEGVSLACLRQEGQKQSWFRKEQGSFASL